MSAVIAGIRCSGSVPGDFRVRDGAGIVDCRHDTAQRTHPCAITRSTAQGLRQIRRLGNVARLGVERDADPDDIACGDPAGDAVGGADADQRSPAHQRDPAAPRVTVDRHSNL